MKKKWPILLLVIIFGITAYNNDDKAMNISNELIGQWNLQSMDIAKLKKTDSNLEPITKEVYEKSKSKFEISGIIKFNEKTQPQMNLSMKLYC